MTHHQPAPAPFGRRGLLKGAAAFALGLPLAAARAGTVLAIAEQTAPPTSLPVAAHDLDWHDAARQRDVPVRLYWPEAEGPVPLMVFSHGLFGSRMGYSYLGRHVAEHGIASLHLQHVGSDRSVWDSNLLLRFARVMQAASDAEATARVHDLRFALDQLLAHTPFGARLDPSRIVAAGHSYGATTAMLAAGAHVVRGGQPLSLRDERLRGVMLLSSPPFYGESDLAAVLAPVQLPSLHITNTDDVIDIPGFRSPASDRLAVFEAIGSAHKALAVFSGGGHSVFTDRTSPGGAVLNARVKQATRELALTFLDSLFRHGRPTGDAFVPWRLRHAGELARLDLRLG